MRSLADYFLGREVDSILEGLHAFKQNDDTYEVRSVSRPGLRHDVIPELVGRVWFFRCGCESGEIRQALPIPCKHAATVAHRFEREKKAKWVNGVFVTTSPQAEQLPTEAEVFAGL